MKKERRGMGKDFGEIKHSRFVAKSIGSKRKLTFFSDDLFYRIYRGETRVGCAIPRAVAG